MRRFCVTAPIQDQLTIYSWSEIIVVAALRVQVQRCLDFRVTLLGYTKSLLLPLSVLSIFIMFLVARTIR